MPGPTSDMSMFTGQENTNVPGMAGKPTGGAFKQEDYYIRIQRFVIDGQNFADAALLESLWTAGLDPTDDSIIIFNNKEFTYESDLIVVVTFMEHKKKPSSWRSRVSGYDQGHPTAQESIEGN